MMELKCSLADINLAERRFNIIQFKHGHPYFIYLPDTTLMGSIKLSAGEWTQFGGPIILDEIIVPLGAHIVANVKDHIRE